MLNAKEAQLKTQENINSWNKQQEDEMNTFIALINSKILEAIENRKFSVSVSVDIKGGLTVYQQNFMASIYQKLKYRTHFSGDKFHVSWDNDTSQMSIR